jgi:hypothetical protein
VRARAQRDRVCRAGRQRFWLSTVRRRPPGLPSRISNGMPEGPPPRRASNDIGLEQVPAAGCGELSPAAGGLQVEGDLVGVGSRDRASGQAPPMLTARLHCYLASRAAPGAGAGCHGFIIAPAALTECRAAGTGQAAPGQIAPPRIRLPREIPSRAQPAGRQRHPGGRTQHRPAKTHRAPHTGQPRSSCVSVPTSRTTR